MTSISSLNLINNLASSPSSTSSFTESAEDRAATQSATSPQPSTIVTLGQTGRDSLQTYSIPGASANTGSTVTWASNSSDSVSKLMAENYLNQALGSRLNGLGSALLDQFGST